MTEQRDGTMPRNLPAVRGRLTANAPLGRQTWFGVGGPAEVMFQPADANDLIDFLAALTAEVALTVVGVGSNLLVRDGGVPGVTIRLGRGLSNIAIGHGQVRVGAGALDRIVARAAAEAGLAGLEFLSGIPGTIGGSLRMNAGAYGAEIKDVLISATALDHHGRRHVLDSGSMNFTYRDCGVDPGWIFLEARLHGISRDREEIGKRLTAIRGIRDATQPVRARTSGSTFRNPPGESAWRLIDAARCRGLRRGGAMVSHKHANFLINTGRATAADIEGLGEEVRRRVYEKSGIVLEWEICRIGRSLPELAPVAENDRYPLPIGTHTHAARLRQAGPARAQEESELENREAISRAPGVSL
jgi:UDP-N-acetylmuramate dehydrogenase